MPNNTDLVNFVNLLKNSNNFDVVEYNHFGEYGVIPNDSLLNSQWSLPYIKLFEAFDITMGSPSVKVAILDSGTDWTHPDLGNGVDGYTNIDETLAWNFVWNNNNVITSNDHGTVVAGVVGAKTNNSIGIVGISGGNNAPGVTMIPICVGVSVPSTSILDDAILYAVEKGARVIQLSLSVGQTNAITDAIAYAIQNNVIVICSSGNSVISQVVRYPASLQDVIAVGAIGTDTLKASFSCYGTELDIVAPGVNILSTSANHGYRYASGTSFSAPMVSAVAALILSVNPNLTGHEVRYILESTAQKVRKNTYTYGFRPGYNNNLTWNNQMGYGLVDAYAAIRAAQCFSNLPIENGIITQSAIWNTPRQAVDVIIPNGVTLTITSQVKCDMYSTFTVQPGAKLIIDGGELTKACVGGMWQGIKVIGNTVSIWPPGPLPDGIVEIRNGGRIENAVIGIHATNGGIVKANSAFFTNNTINAHIDFFSTADFTNSFFTINNNYLGNPLNFETLLKLSYSDLVTVSGCHFLNANNQIPVNQSNVNNIGIKAFDSDLFCTNSSFTRFSAGISASNSGTMPSLYVNYCSFNNSSYGIRINGINNHQMIRNNFNLSFGTGAGVSNATGYTIQENNFYGLGAIGVHSAVGLRIYNSGIAENVVYKNFFHRLYGAQQFTGINATQNKPASGLQTICNTFEASMYSDILVGAFPNDVSFQYNYIRKAQGSPVESAGNLFNGTPVLNISNHQSLYTMDYYYNPLITNEYPIQTTNVIFHIANANTCPSKLKSKNPQEKGDGEDFENAFARYDEWNSQYEYWFGQLIAFQGGEDEEYKIILDNASYFSSLKDNFWNLFIATVMNEEKVEDGKDGKGEIEDYKLKFENLRYLFGYRGNYSDNLSIAETYLAENNYGEARATIGKIYNLFEITEEQSAELKGLQTYIDWRQKLNENEKNIFSLSEKEIEHLQNYVEINTGRGTVFAKNILCALYNICLEEEVVENSDYSVTQNQTEEEAGIDKSYLQVYDKLLLDNVSIVPNPTTGELKVVAGELKIDKIEVFDIVGKVVLSHLPINQKIDISNLNNGIYFIRISTKQGEIVKKVVKQ
ncbi:MAG: S8 family peptidase [Lentimicrobiaceae bacterium]|nr:S8 family peptidase [Lentimicrobiaceae bacterium]